MARAVFGHHIWKKVVLHDRSGSIIKTSGRDSEMLAVTTVESQGIDDIFDPQGATGAAN